VTQHISAEVKEHVVQQHIAGLGRNIISKRMGLSRGSVTNILKAYKCGTAKFTGLGYPKTGHTPEAIQTPAVTLETSQLSQKSPYSQIQEGMKGAEMQVLASELQAPEAPVAPESPTIDWDLDSGWARIFEEVKEAKRQRRDELLLIEHERRRLELDKIEFNGADLIKPESWPELIDINKIEESPHEWNIVVEGADHKIEEFYVAVKKLARDRNATFNALEVSPLREYKSPYA
jgi:hypothetical protein